MAAEARAEGFDFLDTLLRNAASGAYRFERPGEKLLGMRTSRAPREALVAIGGLGRDPYTDGPRVARVRHVYVAPAWRGCDVGARLVAAPIADASTHFGLLRVRSTPHAMRFCERCGFAPVASQQCTHVISYSDSGHDFMADDAVRPSA